VTDHCLRSRNYVNVIVAGKQPSPQWLTWTRPSSTAPPAWHLGMGQQRSGQRARRGDGLLRRRADARDAGRRELLRAFPDLKVRVINVVNLMKLQPQSEHPARPERQGFRRPVHHDKPIIFAFHGYPWLIHRLTYRRTNHATCTCAATRKKARPPRPSTWSC
jgi:xylulose-5-phosphate/fructose-6-phosphate phosphoketolase